MKSKTNLFFLSLIILYFALRLPNLTLQPIFADEAIYIRWAQIMRAEPGLRFLPLSDGKTPLFMWLMMPLFKIFSDPLLAGRFLSVISGCLTLLGVFFLSKKIFGSRVALLATLFFVVLPYTVFFDRMALVDSMLAAFSIWSAYFALWLLREQRLDVAMILGYLLGGGLLTKTPAMVNLLILPVTALGLDFKKIRKNSFPKLLIFWLVALGIALTIYNLLRLGPEFQQLSLRNNDYMFSLSEVLTHPLDPFVPHLRDVVDFASKLFTLPLFLLTIWGVISVILKRQKLAIVILLWALIPLIIQMAILKTFTARYLLFSVPPLLIIAALGLENFWQRFNLKKPLLIFAAVAALIALPISFDYQILTAPEKANLPAGERRGYLEDWTAGYNFKEIADYLIAQKASGPVVVGTEGFFGTLPDGLYIYLDKADIRVVGGSATISAQLRASAKQNQTFFVANKGRVGENLAGGVLLKQYPKAKPLNPKFAPDAIILYKVLP
ncbi:MAG: glycosyltransferase family 39 protein [Candidatus Daviesbacteria bacterium]|nr:MAG: glycosyltransferase family 39 protein [Candidatus Daviesbacteria bacterium]